MNTTTKKYQFNVNTTYLAKKNITNNRDFVGKNEQYDVNFQKSTDSWARQETGGRVKALRRFLELSLLLKTARMYTW